MTDESDDAKGGTEGDAAPAALVGGDAAPGGEVGSAVEKAAREGVAGVQGDLDSDEQPSFAGQILRFWRALNPFAPSDAQRLLQTARQREEATWDVSDPEVLNLTWISRTRHAEAGARGHRANNAASWLRRGGILASLLSAFVALTGFGLVAILLAESCISVLHPDKHVVRCAIPGNLWEFVIATSSAALITLAIAVALFKAAREVSDREMEHAREMTATRKLQTAIRVIEYGKRLGSCETQKALHGLAAALISQSEGGGSDAASEATASAQKVVEASAGALKSVADAVTATAKLSGQH